MRLLLKFKFAEERWFEFGKVSLSLSVILSFSLSSLFWLFYCSAGTPHTVACNQLNTHSIYRYHRKPNRNGLVINTDAARSPGLSTGPRMKEEPDEFIWSRAPHSHRGLKREKVWRESSCSVSFPQMQTSVFFWHSPHADRGHGFVLGKHKEGWGGNSHSVKPSGMIWMWYRELKSVMGKTIETWKQSLTYSTAGSCSVYFTPWPRASAL